MEDSEQNSLAFKLLLAEEELIEAEAKLRAQQAEVQRRKLYIQQFESAIHQLRVIGYDHLIDVNHEK